MTESAMNYSESEPSWEITISVEVVKMLTMIPINSGKADCYLNYPSSLSHLLLNTVAAVIAYLLANPLEGTIP